MTNAQIQILDSALSDQIAAGEVVERAASVVKELVENSLDAGARKIDVEITGGGRTSIRVVDDGHGMGPEDARLSVQRHATSKIRNADDLWDLHTFGFRGEALPSIASVSKFSLATRPADRPDGFRVLIEGGVPVDQGTVGIPTGTQIDVRELFYNTPARQKFQKTEATESANVSEAVLRLALANPSVHFRLRSNGRVALDFPPHRDLGERVRAALARRGAGPLHSAQGKEPLPGGTLSVQAFLGAPEDASTTSRSTFLFVGKRFVRDRALLQALCMGYGELLEHGRYPLAALFLDAPAEEVDVNVHPQKLEVRFASAQRVAAAVRHVVRDALARAPWLRPPIMRAYSLPPANSPAPAQMPLPARASEGGASHRLSSPWAPASTALRDAPSPSPVDRPLLAEEPAGFFGGLRYLGQLDRTYIVCEGDRELILVDQHSAHERVAFERLREAYRHKQIARQRLLFPVPIEVGDLIASGLPELLAPGGLFDALGFDAELQNPKTILLRAVPELLASADPKPMLLDVLARAAASEGEIPDREAQIAALVEPVLATMACHGVVRAGDTLSPEQVRGLLKSLDGVDLSSHNPHGRPVLLRMPLGEIERRFGR
jgi:DNA mismatch repair protein MutL